jgi:tRNA threonylcarbamoyladenosine modification (KEOPS) complex  Pcc1 subunit
MDPADDLVVLQTYLYRREAEMARSVLEAFGIESMLSADDLGGVGVGADLDEGLKLLVRAEDVADARDALLKQPATVDPTKAHEQGQ